MKMILCIDDMPDRYTILHQQAFSKNIFVAVTCREADVKWYLQSEYNIVGICLDHDMPTEGTHFAQMLPLWYPVAVTSLNSVGAARIADIFHDRDFHDYALIPALHGWEPKAWELWKPWINS